MRIGIAWRGISGYFAACVRALAARDGVEPIVLAAQPGANASFDVAALLHGIEARLVPGEALRQPTTACDFFLEHKPDVLLVCGWADAAYWALLREPGLRQVPVIMALDNIPRPRSLRQRLAPIVLAGIFRRVTHWFVPGERSRQLLRCWGIAEQRISRGLYAIEESVPNEAYRLRSERLAAGEAWPRQFLFVGQYVPRKGLDVLLAAYRQYRQRVGAAAAWPLVCCGRGEIAVVGEDGVGERGFMQPSEMAPVLAAAGALVLPSRLDHWGQVIAEAALAGLPVAASTACGAEVELIRDRANGRSFPPGNPEALAAVLTWLHAQDNAALQEQGETSRALASPYTATAWAAHLHELAAELLATDA